jgi:hypothetical protein
MSPSKGKPTNSSAVAVDRDLNQVRTEVPLSRRIGEAEVEGAATRAQQPGHRVQGGVDLCVAVRR